MYDLLSFLSGWVELETELLTEDTNSLNVSLQIRTAYSDGLLFFSYGGRNIYIYSELVNGRIVFTYRQDDNVTTVTTSDEDVNLCDGKWRRIQFSKVSR